jgi:uncharacterized membrane-anchored protein
VKFPIARINAKVGGLLACLPFIGGFAIYDFFQFFKNQKKCQKKHCIPFSVLFVFIQVLLFFFLLPFDYLMNHRIF